MVGGIAGQAIRTLTVFSGCNNFGTVSANSLFGEIYGYLTSDK